MLLVPALLLGAYGTIAIIRTGGDWMDWAWAITGWLAVAVFVFCEVTSSRSRRKRLAQLDREYAARLRDGEVG